MNHLEASGCEYFYIVEPVELEEYRKFVPGEKILVLPLSGQGLAYVRNWIHSHAQNSLGGNAWYWMFDDDITSFYGVDIAKQRNYRIELANVFDVLNPKILNSIGFGQFALEYKSLSWNSKKAIRTPSYCDVAVCISTSINLQYRPEFGLKVDRDFTAQVLGLGLKTARFCRYAFGAPTNSSLSGGLQSEYQSGREARDAAYFTAYWSDCSTFQVKPNGRTEVKIDWKCLSDQGSDQTSSIG